MHGQAGDTAALTQVSSELTRFLYRPIVFREPDRIVHPPSWLEHIPFAFWIVEAARPRTLVELGTQSGNSYAAFAQAIQLLALPTAAYAVDTWRGDDQAGFYDEGVFEEWERYHARQFPTFSRLIRSTFDEALPHFADGAIDLLHIDGCHTYEAVASDYASWLPKLSDRGIVLFHDTNVRERDFGAWRLWEELRAAHPSFEFLHGHGLGVLGVGRTQPAPVEWLFSTSARLGEAHQVRAFFSRLGSAVGARYSVDALQDRLATERAAHGAEVAALTSQLGAASASIGRLEAHVRYEQEQSAALRQQGEHAVQQVQAAVRGREEEARRRQEAETALAHDRAELHHQLAEAEHRREQVEEAHAAELGAAADIAEQQALQIAELQIALAKDRVHARPASTSESAADRAEAGPRRSGRLAGLSLLRHPRRLREARAIGRSGLFDEAYYLARYPDVAVSGMSPLAHFVLHGGLEGRAPHPLFDADYYLRRNPDVAARRVNPLAHYVRSGVLERRNPSPVFDVAFYLDSNPDVAESGTEPLSHFLRFGAAEGRNPNPFFDCAYYRAQVQDAAAAAVNPLVHFMSGGWRSGARPSAAFDPAFYRATYEDVGRSGENPLAHFLEYGRADGRAPSGTLPPPSAADAVANLPRPTLTRLTVRSPSPGPARRVVLCATPFAPLPGRGDNEYRVHRLLTWLRARGYTILPVVAPLSDAPAETNLVGQIADAFGNAVVCQPDGRLDYILADVPDVLAPLDQEFTRPSSVLDAAPAAAGRPPALTLYERTVCHDALITTLRQLHASLRPYVFLGESIWISRVLPLLRGSVLKVVDLVPAGPSGAAAPTPASWPGITAADLLLTLRAADIPAMASTLPGQRTLAIGVDCEFADSAETRPGHRVLCDIADTPRNRAALSDFLMFAWPRVRRDVPDAELLVRGAISGMLDGYPLPGVHAVAAERSALETYAGAAVAISPAATETSGCRREILDAIAHLRPIVAWAGGSWPVDIEQTGGLCREAHDWFEFARAVVDVLRETQPRQLSPAERENLRRSMHADQTYAPLGAALDEFFEEEAESRT